MVQKKARSPQRYIPPEDPTPAWARLFDISQIESLLQSSARDGRAISYAETLNCLGMAFSRPKMRALCVALGEVDRRAKEAGQPDLAVLVVRASDNLPGAGWWVEKDRRAYKGPIEGPKALAYIQRLQKKAFTYWKER